MNKTLRFGDDSSDRLWLAIALISSTESCVIGYKAALYKRLSWLSASQSANADLNLSTDAVNDLITPVWLCQIYKNMIRFFLSFGSWNLRIWGKRVTLNGHDASGYTHDTLHLFAIKRKLVWLSASEKISREEDTDWTAAAKVNNTIGFKHVKRFIWRAIKNS